MNHQQQQPIDSPKDLRRFVEAARAQPIAATRVSAEAVFAGLEHRRRRNHARRIVTLSATMAVAASLIAVGLIWPLLSGPATADDPRHAVTTAGGELDSGIDDAPSLASSVRLRSTGDVEIRGSWSIALRDGSHEIEVDAVAGHRLAIELPYRKLELVSGRMTIDLERASEAVRLHTGVAAWIDEHGERTQISVERIDLEPPASAELDASASQDARPSTPSAAALAREAEQLLAMGKRDDAIAIYRQLVRKHPRASQTRTAVVDLARLLRADGNKDAARCAYRLYLERWPDSGIRSEVESQLERLGDGPSCRGLDVLSK